MRPPPAVRAAEGTANKAEAGHIRQLARNDPAAARGKMELYGRGAFRGLDSDLTKTTPSPDGLCQKNYRNFRRRLELYVIQCGKCGRDA